MTEDLKVDIDPGGSGGNSSRGPTVVIAVLSIAIVAALVFVGVAVVLRFVNGPEAEPTTAATLEPTSTVVAETTVQPSLTPTAGPTATGTQPTATLVDRTPTSEAGATGAPTTEAPATDTPPTEPPAGPTATPRPPAKPATMASPDYGIQAFLWWRPEVAHRDLGLIRDAGFTWVKQWFAWRDIEGAGQGEYDWETADRIVDQVEEFGLKLIVRVDHGPQWAGPPPSNSDHF
ncbi:MAG: beta-galactosidase, partial [Anaerolineae bacterium]